MQFSLKCLLTNSRRCRCKSVNAKISTSAHLCSGTRPISILKFLAIRGISFAFCSPQYRRVCHLLSAVGQYNIRNGTKQQNGTNKNILCITKVIPFLEYIQFQLTGVTKELINDHNVLLYILSRINCIGVQMSVGLVDLFVVRELSI